MKRNLILKLSSLILMSYGAMGASAPTATGPYWLNTKPDVELVEPNLPFDEETGLERVTSPGQQPGLDVTQGQVDQAHGFYSHGTLGDASQFTLEGDGFVKIFRPRNRGFATFDMTAVVGIAASQLAHDYPGGERVQIGDVCAEHGGPLAMHASHQNGLDADIAYMRVNHWEQNPDHTNGFEETFVKNGQISPNFDEQRVWDFVKAVHSTGRLVRIFMDPVIKATLCEYAQKIGEYDSQSEVLRRIRPLANHQDHMHIRISCPEKSPECQTQQDPPAGTGCADVMPKPPGA